MNQSVKLIILQLFSLGLGFFSVFYVAGNIPPHLYAVVGVYEVIVSISRVFSNAGIETFAIRNVLFYEKEGELNKISELITQSLFLRIVFALFLMLPLILYAKYISANKFEGEYFSLFSLMILSSVFIAINDSVVLLLKSFNKYFSAAFVNFCVNILGRLIAIFVFIYFGFDNYIYVIISLPIIITSIVVFKLKKWISFRKHINKNSIIFNLKQSKHFTFSSYIAYVYNMLDQLLVSVFFTAEILSSFTLGKRILTISRTIVGNIFDPMIQKLVNLKKDILALETKINSIRKMKNIMLLIMSLFLPLLIIYIKDLLVLLNLIRYPYLDTFIIFIYVGVLFFVQMKFKYTIIIMFYDSIYNLKLSSIMAITGAITFALVVNFDVRFIFAYLSITYFSVWVYSWLIYKKKKGLTKIK